MKNKDVTSTTLAPPSASDQLLYRFYPEANAGGYSRNDPIVAFYTRVNALSNSEMSVLDFGAGRGAAHAGDRALIRERLRRLRGRVKTIIGVDPDPIVHTNPGLDHAFTIDVTEDGSFDLPLQSNSVDLIISTWTFEHIKRPDIASKELSRVLRPGGWICAITTNRLGYIGIGNRLFRGAMKDRILAFLQPARQEADVFEAYYRMNTFRVLRQLFPREQWLHCSYATDGFPTYARSSPGLWRLFEALFSVTPEQLKSILIVFLRKKDQL